MLGTRELGGLGSRAWRWEPCSMSHLGGLGASRGMWGGQSCWAGPSVSSCFGDALQGVAVSSWLHQGATAQRLPSVPAGRARTGRPVPEHVVPGLRQAWELFPSNLSSEDPGQHARRGLLSVPRGRIDFYGQ